MKRPRTPTHSAEVLPFFFLNQRLEPARLRSRILEMQAAGSDGFFIHAREGLLTPYLSTEWFAAVETCIDVARGLGPEHLGVGHQDRAGRAVAGVCGEVAGESP